MIDYTDRVFIGSHQYGTHIMCNFDWLFSAKAEKTEMSVMAKSEKDMSIAKSDKDMSIAKSEKVKSDG